MRHRANMLAVTIVGIIIAGGVLFVYFRSRDRTDEPPADDLKQRLERLRAVPYANLAPDTADASASGVVVHKRDRAFQGYNLYGSGRSGQAVLMDMDGRVINTWMYPREPVSHWFVAILLPGGDLMVIERLRGLLHLDWNSNLVWEKNIRAHHDLTRLPDSTYYVLRTGVRMHRGLQIRFPSVVHITSTGEVIDEWSTFENLDSIRTAFDRRSFLDTILDSMLMAGVSLTDVETLSKRIKVEKGVGSPVYEYFHANAVSILPENPLAERDGRFRAGNLLICLRNVNQIAVLDQDTKTIHWVWGEGELQWPHHPTMTSDGNILVFDNGVERGYSRIVEVNPITKEIEWQYVGDPPESFFSATKGSAQRLPNGNTLITDSERGRVLEVTRSGEIVWEWLNPETRKGRRLQIYRMERLDQDTVDVFLSEERRGTAESPVMLSRRRLP